MKKVKKHSYFGIVAILILISIILAGIFILSQNEERIKNRDITAIVQVDGKVFVEDIWDINIVNSSTLYQSFDTANIDNFSDIKVSYFDESSNSWIPMKENENIPYNGKENLNYFHAGMYKGNFEIAWGVGLEYGRDRRKYKIEYTVDGPVKNYLDVAEYNHMFVGKDFSLPIENFHALISFPSPLRAETSSIWGHGAPSGEINFVDGKVDIKANKIPANTFVEGRVLFSKEIVREAPEIKINQKASILAEEKRNTENTVISSINDSNRGRIISSTAAAIMLIVGIIIAYEIIQTTKIKKIFSEGVIKTWDRYTDLPATKLNITAANVIYENKGAMNFFVTMLMKLSQKKYLEIIPIKEGIDGSIDSVDEALMEKAKIAEKACQELGVAGNPIEIANILTAIEKSIRAEKAKELHLKVKELENIRYKLNFKIIEKAEQYNQLDPDEIEVIKLLREIYATSKISDTKFEKKIKEAIKKNKSDLPVEVFVLAKGKFEEDIENEKGIVYIEQYQLINHLVNKFTSFDTRYNILIAREKEQEVKDGIYSLEKEKKYNSSLLSPFLQIALLAFLVYLLLTKLIGNVQFNEREYLIALGFSLVGSLMFIFINKSKLSSLIPHLTDVGKNIKEEYQGLYNFLNNDSFIAEYPEDSIVIWGEFLVLATYFGIASKVLKTLKKVHPQVVTELERTNHSFTDSYYMWHVMDTVRTSKNNIAAANVAMAITSGSGGSSGGGGGFTSGGGGGFGGGGGGSR